MVTTRGEERAITLTNKRPKFSYRIYHTNYFAHDLYTNILPFVCVTCGQTDYDTNFSVPFCYEKPRRVLLIYQ